MTLAREKSLKFDWNAFTAKRPSFLGEKVFKSLPLDDLLPFIDWKCFFDVWELRGRYPNGRYPKIFNDEKVGKHDRLTVQSIILKLIFHKIGIVFIVRGHENMSVIVVNISVVKPSFGSKTKKS